MWRCADESSVKGVSGRDNGARGGADGAETRAHGTADSRAGGAGRYSGRAGCPEAARPGRTGPPRMGVRLPRRPARRLRTRLGANKTRAPEAGAQPKARNRWRATKGAQPKARNRRRATEGAQPMARNRRRAGRNAIGLPLSSFDGKDGLGTRAEGTEFRRQT